MKPETLGKILDRFDKLQKVLKEDWGFDLDESEMQNDLPSVLRQRMLDEVGIKCGKVEKDFMTFNTDSLDSRTYISAGSWEEFRNTWTEWYEEGNWEEIENG